MDSIIKQLPQNKGTYILFLYLEQEASIPIGKLGKFDFFPGYYAYVGSAFGSGGLRGRLKHHLRPVKKLHWHIDYLRAHAPLCEIWSIANETILEHRIASTLLLLPQSSVPVRRFGASDCKCESHLFHFETIPALTDIQVNEIKRITV